MCELKKIITTTQTRKGKERPLSNRMFPKKESEESPRPVSLPSPSHPLQDPPQLGGVGRQGTWGRIGGAAAWKASLGGFRGVPCRGRRALGRQLLIPGGIYSHAAHPSCWENTDAFERIYYKTIINSPLFAALILSGTGSLLLRM